MKYIAIKNLTFSYGDNTIFSEATADINNDSKIGVVGLNGSGKTTLFHLIQRKLEPEIGSVSIAPGVTIGTLEQDLHLDEDLTIWEEGLKAFEHVIEIEKQIEEFQQLLHKAEDPKEQVRLINHISRLNEEFERLRGYEYQSRTKGILRGLGFDQDSFSLKVSSLSGGQKTRFALAKLLLSKPDLLLLDEPTNHLDIDSISWLEDFLKSYTGALLVISHDRYFLDKVVTGIIHISNQKLNEYNGNYTEYIKKRDKRYEIQAHHYKTQQAKILKIEKFIEKQHQWNRERNIIAAESRMKMLDKMERIDKPVTREKKIDIRLKTDVVSSNDVLWVEGLYKSYSKNHLFSDLSFEIKRGEKVFVTGPNGCGKTTLLKIIAEKIKPDKGESHIARTIKTAYFDQELEDLDPDNTIIDEVWGGNEKVTETQIRNMLAAFLFTGDDVNKVIGTLSGGEKTRVSIVKLLYTDADFLILDEPTNNLDIASREVLENALAEFEGAVLCVSHDRYFVQKLGTRFLHFGKEGITDFTGDYDTWQNRLAQTEEQNGSQKVEKSKGALDYQRRKELQSEYRKIKNALDKLEKEIEELEAQIDTIQTDMSDPDRSSDHEHLGRLQMLLDEQSGILEEKYEQWASKEEEHNSFLRENGEITP
ncbi:MAG TPA: ABC transporter ATP-binding protein [Clostridiales bacterium]|nr:ABC transporter ATP-binding protein [Clostridiales bacterium]